MLSVSKCQFYLDHGMIQAFFCLFLVPADIIPGWELVLPHVTVKNNNNIIVIKGIFGFNVYCCTSLCCRGRAIDLPCAAVVCRSVGPSVHPPVIDIINIFLGANDDTYSVPGVIDTQHHKQIRDREQKKQFFFCPFFPLTHFFFCFFCVCVCVYVMQDSGEQRDIQAIQEARVAAREAL